MPTGLPSQQASVVQAPSCSKEKKELRSLYSVPLGSRTWQLLFGIISRQPCLAQKSDQHSLPPLPLLIWQGSQSAFLSAKSYSQLRQLHATSELEVECLSVIHFTWPASDHSRIRFLSSLALASRSHSLPLPHCYCVSLVVIQWLLTLNKELGYSPLRCQTSIWCTTPYTNIP